MTAVSKNVYFDVLDDIVKKYNNKIHRTIKMKPVDVTFDFYAEYNVDSYEKDPKFKAGDHVRISKYKNIFPKGYSTVPWTYVVNDLKGEETVGSFLKKNCKRLVKTNLEWKK